MHQNRLREARQKAGLTQVELGRRTRTAPQTLSSIERGVLIPWPKVKRRLARVLKTTQEELFPAETEGRDAG